MSILFFAVTQKSGKIAILQGDLYVSPIILRLMNITTNCDNVFLEPEKIHSFFPSMTSLCGLTLHVRTEPQACIVLIDLEQVEHMLAPGNSRLPERMLSEIELAYFKRFKYAKRQREWLGGRVAVKAAMLSLNGSDRQDWPQLSIMPDKHGRPVADRMKDLSISISHSSRYAVGFSVKGTACGIDLQKVSSKLENLTDRFTTAEELSLLAEFSFQGDLATRLTMLWAAKEALKKSLLHDQPAIFSGIELQHITPVREHAYRFSCSVEGLIEQAVEIYDFSPYILSLTI